jgi:hypothetical protein
MTVPRIQKMDRPRAELRAVSGDGAFASRAERLPLRRRCGGLLTKRTHPVFGLARRLASDLRFFKAISVRSYGLFRVPTAQTPVSRVRGLCSLSGILDLCARSYMETQRSMESRHCYRPRYQTVASDNFVSSSRTSLGDSTDCAAASCADRFVSRSRTRSMGFAACTACSHRWRAYVDGSPVPPADRAARSFQ